jgi:hypothetical protein
VEDRQIRQRISELIEEERALREQAFRHELDTAAEQARLADIEARLDQWWDLLRQRHASREHGQDPEHAEPRPVDMVEDYEQ